MKMNLRRTAFALMAAGALAVVAAAPAAANATHNGVITGGTITIAKTGQTTEFISLTPDPTSTCPASVVTFANANESSATGTSTVTTFASTTRFFFGGTAATNHYIAVITGNSTATGGSPSNWNTATSSFTGLTLRLTARLYFGNSTCTVSATNLKCTWNVSVPLAGTYFGDISHPAVSDIMVSGSTSATLTLGGSCAAPFATYTTGTMTVAGLTTSITT